MALTKRNPSSPADIFDRLFGHWPDVLHRPVMLWPDVTEDVLRVEEYRENGTLVIRADMPGIDPAKDVEVTVKDGVLHIMAERKEEEETEEKDFYRHELRYGTFTRDLPMPEGASEEDVKATYKDGVLEVRVPVAEPAPAPVPKKVPVTTS